MGTAGAAFAAEKAPPAQPDKKPELPPTVRVQSGALSFKTELTALVEAVEMAAVKFEPEVWTDLTVVEALPHGKAVTKGQVLIRLETDKLEKQIQELETQQPAAALGLELAEAELDNLEQTTPAKLEAARRAQRIAAEDFEHFEKTGRDQREKATRYGVKSAEQRLEGAKEELEQLQKMYEADDITEETEEIVLKRQKYTVEAAEYSLETARLGADLALNRTILREREGLLAAKRDHEYALQLAEATLPKALAKKRLDVAKLKTDHKTAAEKLAKLKQDLKGLRARAPFDGVVYYGDCEFGKWTTGAAVAKKLVPGGKLAPREVAMTVVNPGRLQLRAAVAETDLYKVKPGLKGFATPVSAPGKQLEARVDTLGSVPLPAGGFDAILVLTPDESVRLCPGMSCKLTLEHSGAGGRLLAPKEAVFEDAGKRVIYVAAKDGPPTRRFVKVGEADDKRIELLEGVKEGDVILTRKPE